MKKKRLFQILLPLIIVVLITVIWFVKNNKNEPPISDKGGETSVSDIETPLEITAVDLTEIQSHGLPVIVDFGSDSCIPCKLMAPVLKKMNAEMQGKAIIHFTDVWKNPEAAQNIPVQIIPTQIFYTADGKPYVPSDEIQKSISFTMYSDKDTNEHAFTVHEGGLTEEQMRSILTDMGVK